MLNREFTPSFSITSAIKDTSLVLEVGAEKGVSLDLSNAGMQRFRRVEKKVNYIPSLTDEVRPLHHHPEWAAFSGELWWGAPMDITDVPLSPQIAANHLLAMMDPDKVYSRDELVRLVDAYHEEMGGAPANWAAREGPVKRALASLKAEKVVENPSIGHYRLNKNAAETIPVDTERKQPDSEHAAAPETVQVEVEIGTGSNAVYGWYYPAYRELAELKGQSTWPIKVGLSDVAARTRMIDSRGYAPEQPVLAFVHNVNASASCEKIYHGQLEVLGRQIGDSVGKEWFNTNLDELRKLAEHVEAQLSKTGEKS